MKSVEDHGYIVELGVPKISGFLSFEDAKLGSKGGRLFVGHLLQVTVTKVSSNGRICNVTADPKKFSSSSVGTPILSFVNLAHRSSSFQRPRMLHLFFQGPWSNHWSLLLALMGSIYRCWDFLMVR